MKNRTVYIIGGIVLVLLAGALSSFAPFWTCWLFSKSEFLATNWNRADILDYWGNVLSVVGTVVLGVIAILQTSKAHEQTDRANQLAQNALMQTEKANKLAAQMQKLEQANFVSMVSVSNVQVGKRSAENPKYKNMDMPNIEIIDLTADSFRSTFCYHIDTMFENDSDYPIVQIICHAGAHDNMTYLLYGMKSVDCAIYIPPHGKQAIRFIVPREIFEKNDTYKFSLSVALINIYDYATRATIHISDLEMKNHKLEYSYRLAKFIDVRPQ